MQRPIARGVAAIALVSLVVTLVSCEDAKEDLGPRLRPVRYTVVEPSAVKRTRLFSGRVKADIEAQLSFKVSGTLAEIPVKRGDRVDVGGVIAKLDPKDYEHAVEASRAELVAAQAQYKSSQANYRRIEQLYVNENASRNELDQALAQRDSDGARVKAADQQLAIDTLRLGYTELKAEFAGYVTDVPVDLNENVIQGKTIAIVASDENPDVEVAIPEVLIAEFRTGLEAKVYFDVDPGVAHPAVVTKVGVATVGTSATYPVTAKLAEKPERVRPGMAAEVAFSFEDKTAAPRFLVPAAAVLSLGDERYTYIVTPGSDPSRGTVERRVVSVGELVSEDQKALIEVLTGLEPGDRVITAGWSRIDEGLEVKIPQ